MENSRINILRDEISRLNLSGIIISEEENIFYLIGIKFPGYLIVTLNECIFLCMDRYVKKVNSSLNIYSCVNVIPFEKSMNILENIFKENEYIGVEGSSMTLKEFDNAKKIFKTNFNITDKIVEKIREVKDEEEIKKIKYICEEISKIMQNIIWKIKVHISEAEIRNEITKRLNEKEIYPEMVRVSSGLNTADPYYECGFRRFNKDDIISIDIVGKKDGYFGEIARTFFIGDFGEGKENYEKIYKVYDKSLKILKKYNNVSEIEKELKKDLEKINWNLNYHTLRSIGISREDEPEFKIGNYTNIKKGMVIAVEPQIYFEGQYGIILKDTVVITDANYITLTNFEKQELKDIVLE